MNKPTEKFRLRISPALRALLICLIAYALITVMVAGGITPEQYDIHVGSPASVTVYATKDIEDTVTTQALRNLAANSVEPSYKSKDNTVLPKVVQDMTLEFQAITEHVSGLSVSGTADITEDMLSKINKNLTVMLNANQALAVSQCDEDTWTALSQKTISLTRDVLNATLPEGQQSSAITSISRALSSEGANSALNSVCMAVVRAFIQPNMLIDEEITQANRDKARDAVEPETVVKGEVIVREGEIVTQAQYAMISSLGLLADDSFDITLICGVALLTLILLGSLGVYLVRFNRKRWSNNVKTPLLLCVIFVLTVGLCLLVRNLNVYMMPVSLGLLLAALLIDQRDALYINVVLALLISLLASASSGRFTMAMFSILIMNVAAGPVVMLVMRHRVQRITPLLAGFAIALTNFVTTVAVGLVSSANIRTVFSYAAWAGGGGLLSAVMCIGFQPLLEWMFNLCSSAKLLELSNPNHPLLRRMLLEASGTYHHSIIVANLAEAAADAIGANGLLARVGAYYHDVGKLKRPSYFKENQMGDNPHNRTDPRVSTAILTAHTRDGVQMAQKARIPDQVIDIIREHHGDTPVIFFYDKAMKQFGDVDIANFRYEGPRPRTKESAIVMLADTVEAAARAMPNPTPEALEQLIHKLVRGKMTDGQLDQSDLTFSDLDRICSAFYTVLGGMFHERIEYPDVQIPPRTDRRPEAGAAAEQEPVPAEAADDTQPVLTESDQSKGTAQEAGHAG